jgi:hypothetical protein
MISIPSKIENQQFLLSDLEDQLKPLGYSIGGGWEYDHGNFDYKIDDGYSYLYLRVPFKAVKGQLDKAGVLVELGQPFLLNHQFERGIDSEIDSGTASLGFNQFQEPEDKDAEVDPKYIDTGKKLVAELEALLLT